MTDFKIYQFLQDRRCTDRLGAGTVWGFSYCRKNKQQITVCTVSTLNKKKRSTDPSYCAEYKQQNTSVAEGKPLFGVLLEQTS